MQLSGQFIEEMVYLFVGIVRTIRFGDCPSIGTVRAIRFGDWPLMGIVRTNIYEDYL